MANLSTNYNQAGVAGASIPVRPPAQLGLYWKLHQEPASIQSLSQTPNWKRTVGATTGKGNVPKISDAFAGKVAPQSHTPTPQGHSQRFGFGQVSQVMPPRRRITPFVRTWVQSAAAPLGPSSNDSEIVVSVLIRGFQKKLCVDPVVEAMLEQAGLESVTKAFTCTANGEIMVELFSEEATRRCIEHFDGRSWANSILSAVRISSDGDEDVATSKRDDAGQNNQADHQEVCASDAVSTTPSDSEGFSSPPSTTRSTPSFTLASSLPSPAPFGLPQAPWVQKKRWADMCDGDEEDDEIDRDSSIS